MLDAITGTPLSPSKLISPAFALWYILALIYYRFTIRYLPNKWFANYRIVILSSIIVSIVAGFIPISSEMAFQRACGFLPFFMIGFYTRQRNWEDKLRVLKKLPSMLLMIVLFVVSYNYLPIFYCNSYYENIGDCGMRVLHLIVAFFIGITILNITPNRLGIFTSLGKYTLMIYLLHPPLIKVMNVACNYGHIERNALTGVVMTIVAVTFIYSVRNLKILKYLR